MVAQIGRRGTEYARDPDLIAEARRHYDRHHWLKLPQLLSPALLAEVQRGLASATFVEMRHDGVQPPSIDLHMRPNATSAMLELVANDRALFRAIEDVTGCPGLVRFSGFIYRLAPGLGHHHNWHNDLKSHRVVAMSINLEAKPYAGGVLQIRERESGRIVEEVENTGPGDAILFRISPELQHRAVAVTGGIKTAFAGWFRTASPLLRQLKIAAGAAP
jgi:2-oxoglutarate-Fe(II)-dependent oxygenase superfamily protein